MKTVVDSLYSDAMLMAKSLIVKRQDLADKSETLDSARNYERYKNLLYNSNNLFNYEKLDRDLIFQIVQNKDLTEKYYNDYKTITVQHLEPILNLHKKRYFDDYVELNNYYRTLYGLPDYEDSSNVYATGIPGVRDNVPVHLLTNVEIVILQVKGIINELITKYPTKRYLSFLGPNKIDFILAREADHLDILKIAEPKDASIKNIFLSEYYHARKFHMAVVYDKDIFRNTDFYDGMIGLLILTSAIRNTVSTNHLFLDNEELLNDILRSYNLYEYFESLPLNQKKKLVQNLDELLMYSGSDRVLIEIGNIFGYSSNINRYYIIKRHNKDANGDLIFPKLAGGEPDYENMYRLDFLKVNVSDNRINLSPEYIVDFNSVVDKDPLWLLDDSYLTKLKAEEFNLTLSKYVSLESAYDTSNLVYEISYFLNLLIDSREYTGAIATTNMHSSLNKSDIFTYIMFLFAVMAKRNAYDGNINYAAADIATLMKYNLDVILADIAAINTEFGLKINASEFLLNKPKVLITNPDELSSIFEKNTRIYNALLDLMNSTTDYKKYLGYEKLKKLLFVSTNLTKIFMKSTGTHALTYFEMLEDLDMSLANKVNSLTDYEEMDDVIQYILEKLQLVFKDSGLQFLFLNTPDMQDRVLKSYFTKMVKLFIASTSDLDSFDIIYMVGGKTNVVRLFDNITTVSDIYRKDRVTVDENIKMTKSIYIKDEISMSDLVTSI